MKDMLPIQLVIGCAAVAALVATTASAHAGANTNAVVRPRSVFADDPQRGKDPFFPESVRRMQVVADIGTNAVARPVSTTQLQLKGISGSKSQPLALINNSTFSAGEAGEVRAGTQIVKIRCREIRDRSVLIEVDGTGEVKELRLREGI